MLLVEFCFRLMQNLVSVIFSVVLQVSGTNAVQHLPGFTFNLVVLMVTVACMGVYICVFSCGCSSGVNVSTI